MEKYKELVSLGVEAYMKALAEINWFSVPQNNREEIHDRLISMPSPLFFVTELHHLWFHPAAYKSADNFIELLDEVFEFAQITPIKKEVVYNGNKKCVEILIQTKKGTYKTQMPINKDSLVSFDNFIDPFINKQLLKKEGLSATFQPLPIFDETEQYVLVPQSVYKEACDKGIIPASLQIK